MSRIDDLRMEFDRAFAAPPSPEAEATEDFLAVRIAGDPCALRIREISHLSPRRKIVAVPSGIPEFLGLASLRGRLFPIYSLARILGHSAPTAEPSWLVTRHDAGRGIAYGFDAFESHLRIPAGQVSQVLPTESGRPFLGGLVRDGPLVRAVIDLAAVTSAIAEGNRP